MCIFCTADPLEVFQAINKIQARLSRTLCLPGLGNGKEAISIYGRHINGRTKLICRKSGGKKNLWTTGMCYQTHWKVDGLSDEQLQMINVESKFRLDLLHKELQDLKEFSAVGG